VLTADELDGTAAGYKRVAGFDRDPLNARDRSFRGHDRVDWIDPGARLDRRLTPGDHFLLV
jgi:hypothetical protein